MHEFFNLFQHNPDTVSRSSARVNLMGEHTDYNSGLVLPMAIPYHTTVEGARREDHVVRVFSLAHDDSIAEYEIGSEKSSGTWIDYVQGLTWILSHRFQNMKGVELRIDSDIPAGSGLSSSAALGVAILQTVRTLFGLKFTDLELALMCQESENAFVGARVGVMDPIACLMGRDNHALLIDTADLRIRHIPLPAEIGWIVMDTGIRHQVREAGYNERRTECEVACVMLGVRNLRKVTKDTYDEEKLPEVLRKRVRHVLTENERVLATLKALEEKNTEELGRLFYESHHSMKDDYQVSLPEIDALVDLTKGDPDIFGARLTGGGFGGSVVMAARPADLRATAERLASQYASETGKTPRVWLPRGEARNAVRSN